MPLAQKVAFRSKKYAGGGIEGKRKRSKDGARNVDANVVIDHPRISVKKSTHFNNQGSDVRIMMEMRISSCFDILAS
jgi:hypothetical protein